MELRPYQREAIDAVIRYWERGGLHPLVEVATGGGKSLILGELARFVVEDCGGRVVIATHRAELIDQDARAVRSVWPAAPLAVWSASLGKRGTSSITVCGVQTVAKKAKDLGVVDVLIVDEANLIPPDGDGQYQTLVLGLREINPALRVVGLTATPYRLGQGYLTQGHGALFTSIVYRADVGRLIGEGWLSPLVTGAPSVQIDTASVPTRLGEFAARDLELAADIAEVTERVADDVVETMRMGRTSALVFSCGVAHAGHLDEAIRARGVESAVIVGDTDQMVRQALIGRFRRRELPCIVSCDVLTVGFDAPCVDVLALVRATQSTALYQQMIGRGLRRADGKADCLILDYGGNIARHGPVDDVKVREKASKKGDGEAPVKTCPNCTAEQPTSARVCSECDTEFPPPEKKANAQASNLPVLSTGAIDGKRTEATRHEVGEVRWAVHMKKGGGTPSVRIDYYSPSSDDGSTVPMKIASEWICIEHEGFAQRKAEGWWRANVGTPMPASCDDAIVVLDAGYMKPIASIETNIDGEWTRVTRLHHGAVRQSGDDTDQITDPPAAQDWGDEDIPF
jgi:DNA repair protein RadD